MCKINTVIRNHSIIMCKYLGYLNLIKEAGCTCTYPNFPPSSVVQQVGVSPEILAAHVVVVSGCHGQRGVVRVWREMSPPVLWHWVER